MQGRYLITEGFTTTRRPENCRISFLQERVDDGELTRSKRFITKVLCESFFKGFLRGGRDVLGYLWMGLGRWWYSLLVLGCLFFGWSWVCVRLEGSFLIRVLGVRILHGYELFGICFISNREFNKEVYINETVKSINHRGPDDYGYYNSENVLILNTRLSIIDLSEKSNQPLTNHLIHISHT